MIITPTTSTTTTTMLPTWEQEAYIKPNIVEGWSFFGYSVSISGDTIVVGAYSAGYTQGTIVGAAYVYKRSGVTWAQQAYLQSNTGDLCDRYGNGNGCSRLGYSVSISGDTIVAGAPLDDSSQTTITNGTNSSSDRSEGDSGAAYVFKRTGSSWVQEAYIKASNADNNDDSGMGDQFGYNVSISGDTIVVGAIYEDSSETTITNGTTSSSNNSATSSGAAYVYKRTDSTWVQQAYLKASNTHSDDLFGYSLSISDDTIVVGSTGEDSNQTTITNGTTSNDDNLASASGAAYVFKRTGSVWEQQAYLKASNAEGSDSFGYSVSISGDTIVVGSPGESSNQTTITNDDTSSDDNSAGASGAAYVFKRTGSTWDQEAYLKASNAEGYDQFGWSVSISGDTIVVGAYGEDSNQTTITNDDTSSDDNSAGASGAAYVFKRTGSIWVQQAYLKASNAGSFDCFGNSVSISGDTIAVGAYREASNQTTITNGPTSSDDNSADANGAVYVYRLE